MKKIVVGKHHYCSVPHNKEMMKYEFWSVFEAACMITGQWPKYLKKETCAVMAEQRNISRAFFYLPSVSPDSNPTLLHKFDLEMVGNEFRDVYESLNEAIKMGELTCKSEYLGIENETCESRTDLLQPTHVIHWVYKHKNESISKSFQDIRGLYLNYENPSKRQRSLRSKVKTKVVLQLLIHFFPKKNDSFYCKHPWIGEHINLNDRAEDNIRKIRICLATLRKFKRKSGRPKKHESGNAQYSFSPIDEVFCIDRLGRKSYRLHLFILAIETAVRVICRKLKEDAPKKSTFCWKNLGEFLGDVMRNDIFLSYVKNAPSVLKDLASEHAYKVIQSCLLGFPEITYTVDLKDK